MPLILTARMLRRPLQARTPGKGVAEGAVRHQRVGGAVVGADHHRLVGAAGVVLSHVRRPPQSAQRSPQSARTRRQAVAMPYILTARMRRRPLQARAPGKGAAEGAARHQRVGGAVAGAVHRLVGAAGVALSRVRRPP